MLSYLDVKLRTIENYTPHGSDALLIFSLSHVYVFIYAGWLKSSQSNRQKYKCANCFYTVTHLTVDICIRPTCRYINSTKTSLNGWTKKNTQSWLFLTDGVYSHQASDIRIATESAIWEWLLKLQRGNAQDMWNRDSITNKTEKKNLTIGH